MAQVQSDSSFEVNFGIVPQAGDAAPAPPGAARSGPPKSLPKFDLFSTAPLPITADELAALPMSRDEFADDEADTDAAGGEGGLWLNGDVLMCLCPDCKAPLTVRIWLMMAECWRCDTCIELSQQQQRDAERLLQEKRAKDQPAEKSSPGARRPPPVPTSAPGAAAGLAARTAVPPPPPETDAPPSARPSARGTPPGERRRRKAPARPAGAFDLLRQMPAWLVSLVFHIVAITLLGIFSYGSPGEEGEYILLSTEVQHPREEGGETRITPAEAEHKFDLPIPEPDKPKTPEQIKALVLADQEARSLQLDPNVDAPELRELPELKRMLGSTDKTQRMLAARDPRVRVEVVKREGGTTLTEAAVSRALRWLAAVQNADGSWSLEKHGGGMKCDSAGTSLALLPFLGAGQTQQTGVYRDTVAKGLRWLIQRQNKETGDLRIDAGGNAGMYAHGQATIVLCEAFAMTGDEDLRVPAQKALDFITSAQHDGGGWRYRPGEPGDVSVLGWQLMALQSGRAAYLTVPDTTLTLASQFLDRCEYDGGAKYGYMPGMRDDNRVAMIAEGLLCRMYLGWNFSEHSGLNRGVDFLLDKNPPSNSQADIYYWYYATQVLHHAGGARWDRWNLRMRDILVSTQEKNGINAGSWAPTGNHSHAGGRIFATSLSAATLEIYYRHAPIFRQIKLE